MPSKLPRNAHALDAKSRKAGPMKHRVKPLTDKQVIAEDPYRVCPSCGHMLTERKCKLVCERCWYFASCSELIEGER